MRTRMSTSRLKSAALFGAAAFGLTAFGGDYIWSGGTSGSWTGENVWSQNEADSENYVINTANAEVTVSGDVSIAKGLYVEAANVVVAGNNYQAAVEATEETEGAEEVAASNLSLGWLHVGAWGGSGDLTFRNGNVVANGLNVANAGNNGTLIIDGANVTDNSWTRFGDWNAKSAGTAELVIQNGGKLTVWQIQSYLNGNSTVTLDNGTLAYHQNANGAPILGNTTQTGADTIYGEDGSTWQPVEQKVVIGTGGGKIEVPADTTVTVNAAVSGNGIIYKTGAGELTFKSGVLGNGVNVNVLAGSATFNGTYATTGDFIVGSTASASAYIAGNVTCAPGKWTLLGNWSDGRACDATITVGPGAVFATDHFQRAGNVNSATVTLKGGTLKATGGGFLTEWGGNAPVDLYVDTTGGTIACEATTTTEEEGEDPVTTPVDVTVASKITGSGTLTWTGAGTLYITGDITGFTGSFVRGTGAGEIVISQEPVATIGSTSYYNVDTALAAAVAAATEENHVEVTLLASTTLTVDSAKTFDNVTVALAEGVELSFTNVAPFSGSYNADTKTLAFVRNAAVYVYVGEHATASTAAGNRPGTGNLTNVANFTINGVASTVAPDTGDTIVIDQPTYMRITGNTTIKAAIRLDALLNINGNTSKWLSVSDISGTGKLVLSGGNRISTSGGAVTISCPVEITSTDVLLQADEGKEFTLKGALSGSGTLTLSRPKNGSGYTGSNLACSDASQFTGTIVIAQANDNVGRNCASFASTCDLSNASVEWNKNTTSVTQTFLYDQDNQSENKTWKFGSLSGEMYPGASGAKDKHPNIEVGALNKDDTLKGRWINYGSSRQPNVKKVGTGTFDVSEMTAANSYTLAGGTLVVSAADKDIVSMDSSITTAELVCTPDDEETTYTFTIHYYTAMIGETGYDSVQDALEAAKAGETVKLTANVTETVRYANENNITLDLNGYTLTSDGVATLCNNGTGKLTITGDGSIVNTADAEDQGIAVWARIGSIVINGGTFVNQSTYEGTVYVGAGTAKEAGATITINGGTFKNIAEGTYHWNSELAPRVLNVWNSYDVSALKVYGGSFGADPTTGDDVLGSSFIPEGYDCYFAYDEETGLYTVATGVAKVGDTWYPSFAEAYAAALAASGNPTMTVKLTGDFTPENLGGNKANFHTITFVKASDDVGPVTIKLTDGTYTFGSSRYYFPEDATLELANNWTPWTQGLATGGTMVVPAGVTVTLLDGTAVNNAFDGIATISGEGRIAIDSGVADNRMEYLLFYADGDSEGKNTLPAKLRSETWAGTFEVCGDYAYAFDPSKYVSANSKLAFNGFTVSGTFTGPMAGDVELVGDGLTLAGSYSAATVVVFSGALTGSGALTVANTTSRLTLSFTGDVSGFSGNVTIDANSKDGRVAFGSNYAGNGQVIYVDTGASATIASTATWTAANVVLLGELTVDGTLTVPNSCIWGDKGTGVIRFTNADTALGYAKFANSWNGTYDAAWAPTTAFNPNAYVSRTAQTLVMSNGFGKGGFFKSSGGNSTGVTGILRLESDLVINNGYADTTDKYLVTFSKVTGTKKLTFFNSTNGNGVAYKITLLDNFSGSLVLNKNNRLEIVTVNVAEAPVADACVVPVTVPEGATLKGDFALTVAGEAYGTLEYRAADGDNPAGLYWVEESDEAITVEGAEVSFAADGTITATFTEAVASADDVVVKVSGSDKSFGDGYGFKVTLAADGLTATIAPAVTFAEATTQGTAAWTEGETDVTLNVDVVPGMYYAAASGSSLAIARPAATTPATAETVITAPKQTGEQGFYQVWVSVMPISAAPAVVSDGDVIETETTPGDGDSDPQA